MTMLEVKSNKLIKILNPINLFVLLVFFLPKPDVWYTYYVTYLIVALYMACVMFKNKDIFNIVLNKTKEIKIFYVSMILVFYYLISNLILMRYSLSTLFNSFKPLYFLLVFMFSVTIRLKYSATKINEILKNTIIIFLIMQFFVSSFQLFGIDLLSNIYTDFKTYPYWGILRVGGTINNPNSLGWFITIFSSIYFVLELSIFKKIFLFFFSLFFIMLTGSRTALLLFPLGVMIFRFLNMLSLKQKVNFKELVKFTLFTTLALTIFISIVYLNRSKLPYMSQILKIFDGGLTEINSFNIRINLWKDYINKLSQNKLHLVFGMPNIKFGSADNDYIYQLVRYGGIGAFLHFISILIFSYNYNRKSKQAYFSNSYLILLLILGLISESTSSWLYMIFYFFISGLFIDVDRSSDKSILYVTQTPIEYNSSATIANMGYISGLSKLGYSVDLLAERPLNNSPHFDESNISFLKEIKNYMKFEPKNSYEKARNIQNSNIPNRTVKNIDKSTKKKKNIINLVKGTIKSFFIFEPQAINISNVSRVDLDLHSYNYIISCSDPKSSHLIVRDLFKIYGKHENWIQIWGDPMYLDITRTNSFFSDKLSKKYEGNIISLAQKIVYVSPLTLSAQKKTFPRESYKMYFVHQSRSTEKLLKNDIENIYDVGYYGAYPSSIRNIMPLYKTLLNSNFSGIICGKTDFTLNSTNDVTILPVQNAANTTLLESKTKVLIALLNKHGTQIPAKIYYQTKYINKPIILIMEDNVYDELFEYFNSFGRYIICRNNSESIKKAIHYALSINNYEYKNNKVFSPKKIASEILG